MKGLRKSLAVMVAAVMLLTLVPAVALAGEDTLTGTFSINASPTVTSVTLAETAMTPQTAYNVTVAVSDADDLSDLTTVVLKVWYDNDGGAPTEGDYDSKTVGDTQSCAIITYTVSPESFVIDPTGGGTTWSLGACEAFDAGELATTTGDCIFVFTPGKVATETTGSDNWQLAAKATDSASQTGWNYDTTPGATMAWYGEVDVPDATTVDWGSVTQGLDFGEDTDSEEAVGVTITYIANGAYDEQVKTVASWGGSSSLDATGNCSVAEEFALEADDDATRTDAVLVDITGVAIDETGLQTGETGDGAAENTLWLKLALTFSAGDYSGTITYIIADGV